MTNIANDRYPRLAALENRIGYSFQDVSLLAVSYTHLTLPTKA